MKLKNRTDYAFRALMEIASAYNRGELISANEIAKREGISIKYLEQILSTLKTNAFIESRQGIGGGYTLARAPETITFGQVIRAFEGAIEQENHVKNPGTSVYSDIMNSRLNKAIGRIWGAVSDVVDNTTIADVCT